MGAHSTSNRKVRLNAGIEAFAASGTPPRFRHLAIGPADAALPAYMPYKINGREPQCDRRTFDTYMNVLAKRMQTVPLAWEQLVRPEPGGRFPFLAHTGEQDPDLAEDRAANNPYIPSGYTYLLQFVAHDMVSTRVPFWAVDNLATETGNERHARLRLEALYGAGPVVEPRIFAPDTPEDFSRTRLQLGKTAPLTAFNGQCPYRDLARLKLVNTLRDRDGLSEPLIADPRNDDHAIIAQLTMVFHWLHNTFVKLQGKISDDVSEPNFTRSTNLAYERAREATTLVYRHIIRHDLLARILHPDVYELYSSRPARAFLDPQSGVAGTDLPLEFSHGAFRFGHCMSRQRYQISPSADLAQTTLQNALQASSSCEALINVPLGDLWVIRWANFFFVSDQSDENTINLSQRIGPYEQAALAGGDRFARISAYTDGSGVMYRDLISAGLAGVWSVNALIEAIRGASEEHARLIRSSPLLNCPQEREARIKSWLKHSSANDFWNAQPAQPPIDDVVAAIAKEPPLPFFVLFEAFSESERPGCHLGVLGSIIVAEAIFGELHCNTLAKETGASDLRSQLGGILDVFADSSFDGDVTMENVLKFIWKFLQFDNTENQVALI